MEMSSIKFKEARSKTQVGSSIHALRKQKGFTQGDLAEKVGVSRAAISQFELGDTTPSTETQKKLSDVLGFDLSNITDISSPPDEANDQNIALSYYPISSYPALASACRIYSDDPDNPNRVTSNIVHVLRLPSVDYFSASVIEINGNSMAPRYPHGSRYVVTVVAPSKAGLKLATGVHLFFLRGEPPFIRRIVSNKAGVLTLRADATGEEFELEIDWLEKLYLDDRFSLYKVGQAVHMPAEE